MDLLNELSEALGKHSIWKGKIKRAIIDNTVDSVNDIVNDHHKCDFGKWLYDNKTIKEFEKCDCSDYYKELELLHKKIHEAAKEIIREAKKNKDKALQSFDTEGEMFKVFMEFTKTINKIAKFLT
jgi:hypothetical protein